MRNNEPFEEGRVAMASAIFTLNAKSFEEHPAQNIYYYFNPNHELTAISKEELQAKFNDGKLDYEYSFKYNKVDLPDPFSPITPIFAP